MRMDEPAMAVPMRADARRNRQAILDAAIELVLEVGGEPVPRRRGPACRGGDRHAVPTLP